MKCLFRTILPTGQNRRKLSLKQIGEGLEADGILTAAGKAKWRPETIKKILKNEKYIGDALLQKTHTVGEQICTAVKK